MSGGIDTGEPMLQHVESLRNQFNAMEQTIQLLKLQVASLEGRMSSMPGYLELRNRFISTFKSCIEEAKFQDRQHLVNTNSGAGGGDALADATLYEKGMRTDVSIYRRLYGMDPMRVLRINHKETITLLNTHATIVSSNHEINDTFHTSFKAFIKSFKHSDFNENYFTTRTDVTAAYELFLKEAKKILGMQSDCITMCTLY
ncbi:hypothetical protein BDZ91DRAFT_754786 [Kalaharituber pfeilii]|nr:hypothetical protein BDZ91DRAFT_754786 [Kalaharituber pfeilii]